MGAEPVRLRNAMGHASDLFRPRFCFIARSMRLVAVAVPLAFLVGLAPSAAHAGKCDEPGGLTFLGKTANESRSVWLSATGAGSFALQAEKGQQIVDTWERTRRSLHITLSPVVSPGSGDPHSLLEVSGGSPCEIDKQNQKGGITFPPHIQLPPKLPPILRPPSGVMPSLPISPLPPVGKLPPSGLMPGLPGGVRPPIGTLPPGGVTPGLPTQPVPITPGLPVQPAPPIGTLPPGGITPGLPTQPVPITPGLPVQPAPPIGTLPLAEAVQSADARGLARSAPLLWCRDAVSQVPAEAVGNVRLVDCNDPRQRAAVEAQEAFGARAPITPGREFASESLWNAWVASRRRQGPRLEGHLRRSKRGLPELRAERIERVRGAGFPVARFLGMNVDNRG
jgi:hypothetical protein